jgi:hypothetical protein
MHSPEGKILFVDSLAFEPITKSPASDTSNDLAPIIREGQGKRDQWLFYREQAFPFDPKPALVGTVGIQTLSGAPSIAMGGSCFSIKSGMKAVLACWLIWNRKVADTVWDNAKRRTQFRSMQSDFVPCFLQWRQTSFSDLGASDKYGVCEFAWEIASCWLKMEPEGN